MATEGVTSTTYNSINNMDPLSSGIVTVNNLTPDALMIYLQDRMGDIDTQANAAFEKQKTTGAIQKYTADIQNELGKLPEVGGDLPDTPKIAEALKQLDLLAPDFAKELRLQLGTAVHVEGKPAEAKVVDMGEGASTTEFTQEVKEQNGYKLDKDQLSGLKTTFQNYTKQLESSASLEMIHLQSIMSARQTAVQLSTNLVSALGKSQEAIAANIGH
jgi:hypothetical protein